MDIIPLHNYQNNIASLELATKPDEAEIIYYKHVTHSDNSVAVVARQELRTKLHRR